MISQSRTVKHFLSLLIGNYPEWEWVILINPFPIKLELMFCFKRDMQYCRSRLNLAKINFGIFVRHF